MSVTTVSSSMITDATILNADIGAAAAIATTKLGAGATVQVVNVTTGAVATGTTTVPLDDTIPQKTEGDEFMTLAITPTHASNKLIIEVTAFITQGTTARWVQGGLFQDDTANALAFTLFGYPVTTATLGFFGNFSHYMAAGTTSETTFKFRAGPNAASTTTFNGQGGSRLYGGVIPSSMTITEIKV